MSLKFNNSQQQQNNNDCNKQNSFTCVEAYNNNLDKELGKEEDNCQQQKIINKNKLILKSQSIISPRSFQKEIRGRLDITNYLLGGNTAILLDIPETELGEILIRMIGENPKQFYNTTEKDKLPKDKIQKISSIKQYISFSNISEKLFTNSFNLSENCLDTRDLQEYLQAIEIDFHKGIVEDQNWFALYCSLEHIFSPRICFARLEAPTNFGPSLNFVRFILLKETKSAFEITRTFGTLLANPELRNELLNANNEYEFVSAICEKAKNIENEEEIEEKELKKETKTNLVESPKWHIGRGLIKDFKRRLPHYKNDFLDGIADSRSFQKTISSAVFLFFIVLPTAIALGMLNDENTHSKIIILGQWIGGLLFGIFGGQLFLVILTSPPISIYIKVIERISHSTNFDFFQIYSGIGLWCCFYLLLFALFEAANVMKYAKRSLEELFSLFIACTLTIEAFKASKRMLDKAFLPHCSELFINSTNHLFCDRSVGLLFLLLMFGTAWLALTLANFRKTKFFGKYKREIVSDYALPLAVCAMTLIANFWFGDVPKETFNLDENTPAFNFGKFWMLPLTGHLLCCFLGLPLAILFAMDQMLVTSTVDNAQNNLKKGPAANWDFMIVSLINIPLSLFCLPWMHAALPQSFLHLKAQADVEDKLLNGTVQPAIVKNRESRLATLLAHSFMVPTYFLALNYLRHFPTSVFNGVFLFLAYSSTIGNEICQRTLLLFTEQRSYPPTHYIRRVPQRIVHLFTLTELFQLAILLIIGHFPWPVIRLFFPLALIIFIPLRALIFPCIFKVEHLEIIDGVH
uniref:Bicarbonate transporter-like transmembrane domain-containing protein n=1 Tax=Meloidogyne floridensis TaxID=298350 RepID=A0A915NX36_9BILA